MKPVFCRMNSINKKKVVASGILFALLLIIPLTVSMLSKQQESNTHAAGGSTTLYFTPSSTTTTPITTNVGDNIDLNLYVDPGSNQVTFVKYQVMYDPTKVELNNANPITLNTASFTNVEGPVASSGAIAQSVSIGADPTKVITTPTEIVTLHFIAVGGTNEGTTSIAFNNISEVLSSGPSEQATQNVLASTTPAIISISGTGSPSISPVPTITGTALNFTVLLDGVGAAGDNPNPSGNSLSNKNPLHPQRNLNVEVFDTNNQIVASSSAPITYDSNSGTFDGEVGLPATVPSGNYYVKIQTDRYLRKLVPGITQITSGQTTQMPTTQMVTGDTNNDNVLNVLDYNALLDCGYGDVSPLPMNDPNSAYNTGNCQNHTPTEDIDLNDDGIIDSTDYNLFLRELSVQNGD
jgi:hypothetical protein